MEVVSSLVVKIVDRSISKLDDNYIRIHLFTPSLFPPPSPRKYRRFITLLEAASTDGVEEGSEDGTADDRTESILEAATDGSDEGLDEDGLADGLTDGNLEAVTDGVTDGVYDVW